MADVVITVGPLTFEANFEREWAPLTCAAFERLLPFEGSLIQARWSGEAAWVPLGDLSLGVPVENPMSEPEPGQVLLYPGGTSETEILVPYGKTSFACRSGALEGNHFLTIVAGHGELAELGRRVVWEGAQRVSVRRAGPNSA